MSLFLFFQDGIDIVEDTADLLESLDLPPDSDDIDGVVDVLQGDIKGDLRTDIKDYVQDIKAVLKQVNMSNVLFLAEKLFQFKCS